jgi:hypothetical protein
MFSCCQERPAIDKLEKKRNTVTEEKSGVNQRMNTSDNIDKNNNWMTLVGHSQRRPREDGQR